MIDEITVDHSFTVGVDEDTFSKISVVCSAGVAVSATLTASKYSMTARYLLI
jgi:hypothetical protein